MTVAPPQTGRAVSITVDGAVCTLTLTRPDAGNAISLQLARDFRAAIDWLARADDVRVLVIAGSGKLFCAGGDVREMADAADRPAFLTELVSTMHQGLLGLRELPIPIVAAVHGPVAGAGNSLVLSADLAVASTVAKFSSAYSKVGLSPDCGFSSLLPSALGSRRAALFSLTDIVLTADQALEWGMVTHTCPPDELSSTVREISAALAARPGRSAGETARLLRHHDRELAQQLDDEERTISALSGTPEAAIVIEQFATRAPSASGRNQ